MGRKRRDIFFGFRRDTEERIVKRRLIEKAAVPVPKHKNKKIAGKVQIEKEYLILDLFRKNTYIGRYVLDTETGEHAYVSELGHWHSYKLLRIMGYDPCTKAFTARGY